MKRKVFRITTFVLLIVIITIQSRDLQFGLKNLFSGENVLGTAQAVGGLTVDWGVAEGNPIFVVTNAAPGDTQTRNVQVTNGDVMTLPLAVKGLNLTASGGLENVLDFVIRREGVDIYGGTSGTGPKTLAQFMTDSVDPEGVALGNINPSEILVYDFEIHFQEGAGNAYQDTSVEFDLVIGIGIEIPEECSFIDLTGKFPIFGTNGNDRINGTTGDDVIFGFGGNDKIYSKLGNDCVIGGLGNDKIYLEVGDDIGFGNEGNDEIRGGVGGDTIFGGIGNDELRGENGSDEIHGNEGDDEIRGDNDNDVLYGDGGADELRGENGEDTISGGSEDDEIDGGAGNDVMSGNDGNDEIDGKAGDDTMTGDAGTDKGNGHSGFDTCTVEIPKNCES